MPMTFAQKHCHKKEEDLSLDVFLVRTLQASEECDFFKSSQSVQANTLGSTYLHLTLCYYSILKEKQNQSL